MGNYEEARSLYEVLAKDAKHMTAATLGLSRTLQSRREYDKAMNVSSPRCQTLITYPNSE